MSDPLTDAANAISDSSPKIKAFARLAAQRIIALEAPAPPPPPPPPPPDTGTVLKTAGFDNGTFSEWSGGLEQVPGRAKVLTQKSVNGGPSAGQLGTHWAEAEVRAGDLINQGERCEWKLSVADSHAISDSKADVFYGFALWFPSSNPLDGALTQFHSTDFSTSGGFQQPNVDLYTDPNGYVSGWRGGTQANPKLVLGINGGNANPNGQEVNTLWTTASGGYTSYVFDLGPLLRDQRVDVVLRCKWSVTPADGIVQAWVNGQLKASQIGGIATSYKGFDSYVKQGIYRRKDHWTVPSFAWYSRMKVGTSYAAVAS